MPVHLNSCLKRPGISYRVYCVFATHSGKGTVCCVESEIVCAISQTYRIPLVSFFRENHVFQTFFQSQVEGVCVHFFFFILVSFTKLFEETVIKFQNSLFRILQNKKPKNDWFFVLNFKLYQFNFSQLIGCD